MTPFEAFKEGRKDHYEQRLLIEETNEKICYDYDHEYRFEYHHQPNHMAFLSSIHPHPLMVMHHVLYHHGEKEDEKWLFYVKEPDSIVQIHATVMADGDFFEPVVSFWESSELYVNHGRYTPSDTLLKVINSIMDYVRDMPAYRLYYVTGSAEKG